MVQSYKGLKVWQAAMDLVEQVYSLTQHFPRHEVYGLSQQVRRAAVSIPSNVAEGQARQSTKEYLQHTSPHFHFGHLLITS
ncbi:MAG TPA: four helix bundle protein [Bryobacteraceae bacterium]|nr:four helix bundle protein [Bryobacteraceae bacterium]